MWRWSAGKRYFETCRCFLSVLRRDQGLMMEFLDSVLCLFTSRVKREDDSYVLEIPEQEVEVGSLEEGKTYKVALFEAEETEQGSSSFTGSVSDTPQRSRSDQDLEEPPVEEGEVREVKIEDLGEKGDGIARIPPGYVVFVENTRPGDRVKIKVTEARENFAFAEVLQRL